MSRLRKLGDGIWVQASEIIGVAPMRSGDEIGFSLFLKGGGQMDVVVTHIGNPERESTLQEWIAARLGDIVDGASHTYWGDRG
jgi:hypothetical protein